MAVFGFVFVGFFQIDFEATSGLSGKEWCEQKWTWDVVVWGGMGVSVGNGVIPAKYLPSILWYNFNCVRRKMQIKKQR